MKTYCLTCGKVFSASPYRLQRHLAKYCSLECRPNHNHTEAFKLRMSKLHLAEKNPMWKGDRVGYSSLHGWIKRRLPKPKICRRCNTRPSYDLCNISGKYKRDLLDWEWLCRRCHMLKDGRLIKITKNIIEVSKRSRRHPITMTDEIKTRMSESAKKKVKFRKRGSNGRFYA